MALAYSTTLRNARLDAITTAISTSGLLRIYDGTRQLLEEQQLRY